MPRPGAAAAGAAARPRRGTRSSGECPELAAVQGPRGGGRGPWRWEGRSAEVSAGPRGGVSVEGFAGRRDASAWCQLVRGAGGQEGRGARARAGRARRAESPTGASLGEGCPGRRCGAQTALTCAVGAGSVAKARGAAWAGKGGAAAGERREAEGGRQSAGGGSGARMPTRCDLRAPESPRGPGLAPRLERWLLAAHCGVKFALFRYAATFREGASVFWSCTIFC